MSKKSSSIFLGHLPPFQIISFFFFFGIYHNPIIRLLKETKFFLQNTTCIPFTLIIIANIRDEIKYKYFILSI